MNFMSGLEKFGLDTENIEGLYDDNSEGKVVPNRSSNSQASSVKEDKEQDYLFDKKVLCPVCDKEFKTKTVKASKARIIGSDSDLRPRHKSIDTLKYGVTSCPFCGYSSLNNEFIHVSTTQIRLIRENVCAKFRPDMAEAPEVYTYDYALEKYKLALFCSIVKKGKTSDKAYTCLKMAWLCRGKAEKLIADGMQSDSDDVVETKKQEMYYYKQALEGLTKAIATESFPICGMDQNTIDLLLAQMNVRCGDYETASKLVSRLLVSRTATRNVKDKAYDLKEQIIETIKGK